MVVVSTKLASAKKLLFLENVFYISYAIFFYFVIIKEAHKLSTFYEADEWRPWMPGLRKGWLFGQPFVDLTDSQWRNFREQLWILTALAFICAVISYPVRLWSQKLNSPTVLPNFWLFFSTIYLIYLHGSCMVFLVLFSSLNFIISKKIGGYKYFPPIIWALNCAILVSNRIFDGYKFGSLFSKASFLDSYRGVFRWEICYNLAMLRMLSFGLDYHKILINHKNGQEKSISLETYGIVNYFCYIFYAPLYIAGPISTFDSFSSQMKPSGFQKNNFFQVAKYALRWLFSFLLIEIISHYFHFSALAQSGLWKIFSPLQISVVGYGVLNFMWLKFLLIWRFFRLWSLACGVDCPENMTRCLNSNYDIEGFWKGWHSSYNKWLVRYLYIPLGGAKWRALNTWIIFSFVALWHDLEWKLLSWAWLTCLFGLPELAGKSLLKTELMASLKGKRIYSELCAIGGSLSIAGLMIVNLTGFVVGVEGIKTFLGNLVKPENTFLLSGILFSFYVGTKIMFKIRELPSLCNVAEGKNK